MGGIASAVSSIFGGETAAEKEAKRAKKKAQKLKDEEALVKQAKGQRRVRAAGRRRRVVTNPLGLGDEGLG